MTAARVVSRASWRCLWHPGTDTATLTANERGWRLVGRAEIEFPEGRTTFRYQVDCSPAWEPRHAEVRLRLPAGARRILIDATEEGEWSFGGFRNRDFRGCTDLDFTATPSTNTLALKRLGLSVGESREIRTAWVLFPDLEPTSVRQRYTRLSEDRYRYEGLHNGFVGEFAVDDAGWVSDYPESWERVPTSGRARRAGGPARPKTRT